MTKIHNVRSPKQWEIISANVDFAGADVLDLGCGKGDILIRAFDAGAKVVGIDNEQRNIDYMYSVRPEVRGIFGDIERLLVNRSGSDIIICFSVLPYLLNPDYCLSWISRNSNIALIECQYDGDGPGLAHLSGNSDMERWLTRSGFERVEPIGHTLVEGRNKKRFIWMCE